MRSEEYKFQRMKWQRLQNFTSPAHSVTICIVGDHRRWRFAVQTFRTVWRERWQLLTNRGATQPEWNDEKRSRNTNATKVQSQRSIPWQDSAACLSPLLLAALHSPAKQKVINLVVNVGWMDDGVVLWEIYRTCEILCGKLHFPWDPKASAAIVRATTRATIKGQPLKQLYSSTRNNHYLFAAHPTIHFPSNFQFWQSHISPHQLLLRLRGLL